MERYRPKASVSPSPDSLIQIRATLGSSLFEGVGPTEDVGRAYRGWLNAVALACEDASGSGEDEDDDTEALYDWEPVTVH